MQVAMLACGKMVPEFSHASRIKFLQCSIWRQFLSPVSPHKNFYQAVIPLPFG